METPKELNKTVQWLESWIPGVNEPTAVHDYLHEKFGLGFCPLEESILLAFQLGHHPRGNMFYLIAFYFLTSFIYPPSYRSWWGDWDKIKAAYEIGRTVRGAPYENLSKYTLCTVIPT